MKSLYLFPAILLFASVRSGWSQVPEDFETEIITNNTIVASSFINNEEGWLADEAGVVWHTSNGGGSWSTIATEKHFLKMDFVDASVGYGITADKAFKTTNGGSAWFGLAMPGIVGSALYFLDASTGFISGIDVIYKTTNGGDSWSTISTEGASFVDFYFTSSSIAVAAAFDHDTHKCIWRTTSGGSSWSYVFDQENYFINSVWFTDANTGWAAGHYNMTGEGKLPVIIKTTDGGMTWENIYMNESPGDLRGESLLDIRFKNEEEGIAISSYSENVITSDGGATWNKTYSLQGSIIPSYGIYKTLDGYSDMFMAGRKGFVTKW